MVERRVQSIVTPELDGFQGEFHVEDVAVVSSNNLVDIVGGGGGIGEGCSIKEGDLCVGFGLFEVDCC